MNRDRDRDRDRRPPIPPEDRYGDGRGQSYRPARSPLPRPDTYRAPRSPLPRGGSTASVFGGDSYRAPPRGRSRSPPPPFRRRSRSPPPFRPRGGDSYSGRPRSPPRRGFGRDESYRPAPPRPRSYRDDMSYDGRSPIPLRAPRDRSPLPLKRPRDASPAGSRGRRSPAKRERLDSPSPPPPRGRYDTYPASREQSPRRRARGAYSPPAAARRLTPPRGVTRAYRASSRSPVRHNVHVDPRKIDWRRRSPSPPRQPKQDAISGDNSGAQSVTSSRRSSPPIHPGRMALIEADERPARPSPRDDIPPSRPSYRARSPPPRARSPPQFAPRSPAPVRERSPAPVAVAATRSPPPIRSPPRRRESPPPPAERDVTTTTRSPPRAPARFEEAPPARAPPTGPSASRSYAATTAAAATAAADSTIPSGPRAALSPPNAPRGPAPSAGRGFGRDFPRGGYQGRGRGDPYGAPFRGAMGRGGGGGPPSGPSFRERDQEYSGPPSGPRNSFSQGPPFRQNSISSSATYPRTTRFGSNGTPLPSGPKADVERAAAAAGYDRNGGGPGKAMNPYLADLPRVVEGGQKAPPLYDGSRLEKLEVEAERLRKNIEDKQSKKRQGLREWDRLERDSDTAGYRARLADESVRAIAGESEGGAAF